MATNEQAAQGPAFPPQSEGNSGRLDIGFKGPVNPDDLPLGATQALDHIRFESSGIRKDFGWAEIGIPAASRILAFGEHATFEPSGVQGVPGLPKKYIYRISVDGSGPLRIDKYQAGAWSLLTNVAPDAISVLATKRGFDGEWFVSNSDLLNPVTGDAYFNSDEVTLHVAEISADGYNITPDVPFLIDTQAEISLEGVVWTMQTAVNNGTDWTFTLLPAAQRPLTYAIPTVINWDVNSVLPAEQIPDIYEGGPFLSVESIQDVLAVADGVAPIRIWNVKANFIEDIIPFIGGIPLTSVGEFDDAVVLNSTTAQIPYTSSFDVNVATLTGVTAVDLIVSVEVDEGLGFFEKGTAPYTLTQGDSFSNQSIVFNDVLKAGDTVRLKVKDVSFPDPGVVNGYDGGAVAFNNQIEYRAVYTAPITPVPLEDLIAFHFTYNFSSGSGGSGVPALGDEVEIWGSVREFGEPDADVLITTFINQGQGSENAVSQTLDFSSFGIDWNNIGPGTPGPMNIVIFARNITSPNQNLNGSIGANGGQFEWWNGTLSFSVTPIELEYAYESGTVETFQQITPSNFPETILDFGPEAPVDAPTARYLASFGDRLFGLWDKGDSQILNASSDGNVLMWQLSQTGGPSLTYPDDSVNLSLIDTRVDPTDSLVWMRPVSSQVAILGRHRSLMRVFETGNIALSVGATHWQDGVGSLFPYSIAQTEAGLMYLGNNRMVYYMTADRLIPVGRDIQEELISHLFPGELIEYESVMGAFDPAFGEFYLGIPENGVFDLTHWWVFDLGHYMLTQETKWRKRAVGSNRLVNINVGLAPYSAAVNVSQDDVPPYPYTPSSQEIPQEKTFMFSEGTRIFAVLENERTLASVPFEGEWESPPLSKGAMGEEATLRTLGFTYSAEVNTTFDIEISGDGGQTYPDIFTLDVLATGKQTRRIRQAINTSGYDLRFRVRFNTDKIVKLFNYYPSIVTRGRTVL